MSTDTPKRQLPQRRFTEEEIRRGLLTIATCGNNTETAAKVLKEQGLEISPATLRRWRSDQYPDLYRRLHEEHGREIEAALIPELRETAILAAQASQEAVHEARRQLALGETKDPAGAARNLATTSAVAMDKLYLATDRPTEIRAADTPNDVLQRLADLVNVVEGTAEEITTTHDEHEEPKGHTAGACLGVSVRSNAQE